PVYFRDEIIARSSSALCSGSEVAMREITFRPLILSDLPELHRWLTLPHVARWWGGEATREEVDEEYGAYIRGEEPVHVYLVFVNGKPVGHTQWMRYVDYEWYAR